MAALDHWLNVLDIALKAGQRRDAEKAAAREAKRTERESATRTQRAFGGAGSAGVRVPEDPSCCLAKRRFTK